MAPKKLAIWVDGAYQNDAIFDQNSPLNRDNCLSAFRMLNTKMAARGWVCHTQDMYQHSEEIPDAVLFMEMPGAPVARLLGAWAGKTAPYAALLECEVIRPDNWRMDLHSQFKAIFTWHSGFVDNNRYFKINFPNAFPAPGELPRPEKKLFCAMIAAHKSASHPLELYTERERAIRWFEENHPGEFDLFGIGWDRFTFTGPKPLRALNRINLFTRLFAPRFPSYKGPVDFKRPVLEKYKFAIAYENAREVPGYITEKIFDCMFAGCVPVYRGAPDIAKYVPRACFIDRREFKTHDELYAFMKAITPADYAAKIGAIAGYLASDKPYQFSDKCFAETVGKVIAKA